MESIKSGAGLYVFHSSSPQSPVWVRHRKRQAWRSRTSSSGISLRRALGWGDYRWKHEPFFTARSKAKGAVLRRPQALDRVGLPKTDAQLFAWAQRWSVPRSKAKTTVWSMARDKVGQYVHPTQNPWNWSFMHSETAVNRVIWSWICFSVRGQHSLQ